MNRREYLEVIKNRKVLANRPEKVEEIRQIWTSPKFKTHNQRLTYLLGHCKTPLHGYTIREFANAIHPGKMNDPHAEQHYKYLAYYALRKMFTRYRHDMENHEVMLFPDVINGIWYYYNIIEDEVAQKKVEMRGARVTLGLTKSTNKVLDILEMSKEEREKKTQELVTSLQEKQKKRAANKARKKSKK